MQVGEGDSHGFHIGALVILEVVFLKQGAHAWRDDRVAELGHRWVQVVLDLEIQKTHPPVDEFKGTGRYIHGVDRSIAHPINLKQDRQK